MLLNIGKATMNQVLGETNDTKALTSFLANITSGGISPGMTGVLSGEEMLSSKDVDLKASNINPEFDNIQQFAKDYETWAKGSIAMQTFRGVFGHDDPFSWGMSGFKKGEQGVNFYGYNMIKGLFGGNK